MPTPAQWASLGMEPVKSMTFRSEHMTEGKISINEDSATPIFPPYAGRVTRLMAKPGDMVERGQPLFYIEAADMVQAQNDFLAALAAINRAKSRVTITEIIEKQNRTLYESKAGALRDFQTATADLAQARADLRTAESALEAARNRLVILGKTDAEIAAFQEQGKISSETPIYAPLAGTVVQRKIGPGQYVSYTSHRRRRSGVHHRRPFDRLAGRLHPRERGAEGPRRPAARFHRARLSQDDIQGEHRPRGGLARSEHSPPDGARDDRQRKGQFKPEMFTSRHDLHRRGRQLARRAARCGDLRGRQGARLGRARPTRPSNCARSRPASPGAA